MRKVMFATVLGAGLCAIGAYADQMTGYISESHCGAKHDSVSEANTKCVEACLKNGSDPVFVSDGKVMKIDADSRDKAVKLAGHKVTVDGTADGDTLKINSIQDASAQAQ